MVLAFAGLGLRGRMPAARRDVVEALDRSVPAAPALLNARRLPDDALRAAGGRRAGCTAEGAGGLGME